MMTVNDLFSGIGGFSLGLERTGGFKTIQFCEIDPYARRVLAHHWPEVPCHADIRTMGGVNADVICGGFPCQDISLSGTGQGLDGARSGLWFEYLRLIEEGRPRWVIVENVPALRGRGLEVVLRGLTAIGYDAEWHCIPAAAIGAPHRRDRIWIVAYPGSTRLHASAQPGIYQSEAGTRSRDGEPERLRGPQSPEPLADANGNARRQWGLDYASKGTKGRDADRGRVDAAVADAYHPRLEIKLDRNAGERSSAIRAHDWAVEPDVGRVAYGVPSRVDRLKCLGNAIVPQIAELIGRAILRYEGVA